MMALRTTWDEFDAQGIRRPAPPQGATPKPRTKADDDQFLGEMAADAFIAATDLPFVISEVPKLGGKSEKVDKDKLWGFYRSLMGKRLFGPVTQDPKRPEFQFHLRYLALLDKIREHHNIWLVPYWDAIGHVSWQRNKAALEQADTAMKAAVGPDAQKKATEQFEATAQRYLKMDVAGHTVEEGYLKVLDAYGPIGTMSSTISVVIDNTPEVLAKGISKASSARLIEVLGSNSPWWDREISEHLAQTRKNRLSPPPFAEKKDLLFVVD
jgi:hypothetical protein